MARTPEMRYASATTLQQDVQNWLDDQPVSAYVDSLFRRLLRWSRHHQAMAAAIVASVMCLILAFSVGAVVVERHRAKRTAAERLATRYAGEAAGAIARAREKEQEAERLAAEAEEARSELGDASQKAALARSEADRARSEVERLEAELKAEVEQTADLNQQLADSRIRLAAAEAEMTLHSKRATIAQERVLALEAEAALLRQEARELRRLAYQLAEMASRSLEKVEVSQEVRRVVEGQLLSKSSRRFPSAPLTTGAGPLREGEIKWDATRALLSATAIMADPNDPNPDPVLAYVPEPFKALESNDLAFYIHTVTDPKHPFHPRQYGKADPEIPGFLTHWLGRTTISRGGECGWIFLDNRRYGVFPAVDMHVRVKAKIWCHGNRGAAPLALYDLGSTKPGQNPEMIILCVLPYRDRIVFAGRMPVIPGQTTNGEYFDQLRPLEAEPTNLWKAGLAPYSQDVPGYDETIIEVELYKPAISEDIGGRTYDGETMITYLFRREDGSKENIGEFPIDPSKRYRLGFYLSGPDLAIFTGGVTIEHRRQNDQSRSQQTAGS
jgi:hypothetical protein